jgi:hypothetical protein
MLAKTIHSLGERIDFSTNATVNHVYHVQRKQLDLYLTVCTKRHSKWIKDLNVRAKV